MDTNKPNVSNRDDIDSWLFHRVQIDGHGCSGIKGMVAGEEVNIAFRDNVTGDKIDVIYEHENIKSN